MYLITHKMIYGVDLQQCVFTGNLESSLERNGVPYFT